MCEVMVDFKKMGYESFKYEDEEEKDYIIYTPEDATNKFAYSVFTEEDFKFLCYALGFTIRDYTPNKSERSKYIRKYKLGDVESKRYPHLVRYEFYEYKDLLMAKFFDMEEPRLNSNDEEMPIAKFDLGNMKPTRDSSIQLDLWGRVKRLWMKKKLAYYEKKKLESDGLTTSLSCSTPVIKKKKKKFSRRELLESMADELSDDIVF